MDMRSHFEGKKITVLGLGLLGRGVGDTKYLAEQGAELIVTDLKSREELAASLEQLKDFPNISYRLGEHVLEDFDGRDYILKAAGVPDPSPYLDRARAQDTQVKMSASWFLEVSGLSSVGITGTRGKSTVTHMLHHIVEKAGVPVLLGGNVRGVSTLALLDEATVDHLAILELDSWQCQGFGEEEISPEVVVFTTLFRDHMNYYHDNIDAYLGDKAKLFLHQHPEDTLVIGAQCVERITETYGSQIQSHVITAGAHDLRADWELAIPGEHNRYNAALALEAGRALSIDDDDIREALATFKGVPGRLELVREVGGVKYYNDTTATTPEATIAALEALDPNNTGNIILIMGGADKGLNMHALLEVLPQHAKRVLMLSGTGTNRIHSDVQHVSIFDSLETALTEAKKVAVPGDTVLLSPAFASFGMFKNEYDRGDQFIELVKNIP